MEVKLTDLFIRQYTKLDKSIQKRADKTVDKIQESPERLPLLSAELKDCHKVYFNNKRHRIIYTIYKDEIWLLSVDKRSRIYKNKQIILKYYSAIKGNLSRK